MMKLMTENEIITNSIENINENDDARNIYYNEFRLRDEIEYSNYYNFYAKKFLTF